LQLTEDPPLTTEPNAMPTESKARILVVDDDLGVRRMSERLLGAEGYEVVGMGDGTAGHDAATPDFRKASSANIVNTHRIRNRATCS
jgi:PleD family two-component response regulator